MQTLTVSDLSRKIKSIIETGLPFLQVEGEISNYKPHYSGHAYFTLKDDFAQISVVMWKSNAEQLLFELEDGKHVLCSGRVSVYEKSGRYQLVANQIDQIGFGDLQRQFEQLKRKLFDQGYFDEAHKKTIPRFPEKIGLVTSPTGAAIQDIISIAERRNPLVQLIIYPVKVQGNGAANEIVSGIKAFNEYQDVDLLIIGRGGGSLEDLWAFNEEAVAKAIYESELPVISAVGHEIDFSISDFVADLRAATPSAAAELAIPTKQDMMQSVLYYRERCDQYLLRLLENSLNKINYFKQHYALEQPRFVIAQKRSELEKMDQILNQEIKEILTANFNQLMQYRKQLNALSPRQILSRGYSLIHQNGKLIDETAKLADGEAEITFKDGTIKKRIS
ncbi:MAG: exodeoxyribonuclease VII large subunit [Calditrichaeota bacterium]|nr:exodeoxyribonuclease VII large subunit [Calditrichota bacterium]